MPVVSSKRFRTGQCPSVSGTTLVLAWEIQASIFVTAFSGVNGLGNTLGLVVSLRKPSSTIQLSPIGSSSLSARSHHSELLNDGAHHG